MKKLIAFFLLTLSTILVYSQHQPIQDGDGGLTVVNKINGQFEQIFNNGTSMQFSADGVSNWHVAYSVGDYFMRVSPDYGVTWGPAIVMANRYEDIELLNTDNRKITVGYTTGEPGKNLEISAGDAALNTAGNLLLKGGIGFDEGLNVTDVGDIEIGAGEGAMVKVNDSIVLNGVGIYNLPAATIAGQPVELQQFLDSLANLATGDFVPYNAVSEFNNIGTNVGSYNLINGEDNLTNNTYYSYSIISGNDNVSSTSYTANKNIVVGQKNISASTGNVYENLLIGDQNGYNIQLHSYDNVIVGSGNVISAQGNMFENICVGTRNAFSAAGDVKTNLLVGGRHAYSTTGVVQYNLMVGYRNAYSAMGDIKNSILIGQQVAEDAVAVNNLIGLGEFAFEGSTVDLSESIALGREAGRNTVYTNTALFGKYSQGTKNDQVVIGSSSYNEILLDNNTDINGDVTAKSFASDDGTNSTNWGNAYDHSILESGNPHNVGWTELTGDQSAIDITQFNLAPLASTYISWLHFTENYQIPDLGQPDLQDMSWYVQYNTGGTSFTIPVATYTKTGSMSGYQVGLLDTAYTHAKLIATNPHKVTWAELEGDQSEIDVTNFDWTNYTGGGGNYVEYEGELTDYQIGSDIGRYNFNLGNDNIPVPMLDMPIEYNNVVGNENLSNAMKASYSLITGWRNFQNTQMAMCNVAVGDSNFMNSTQAMLNNVTGKDNFEYTPMSMVNLVVGMYNGDGVNQAQAQSNIVVGVGNVRASQALGSSVIVGEGNAELAGGVITNSTMIGNTIANTATYADNMIALGWEVLC